ncbi:hypothetical protein V6Z11_A05G321100 [Gossypium hirsutum]
MKRYYEGQPSLLESRPSDPKPPDPWPIWSFFCQKLHQTESTPSCSLLVVCGFYPYLRQFVCGSRQHIVANRNPQP